MTPFPIYSVSGYSNGHRALVLRDGERAGSFCDQPWGSRLSANWNTPDLIAASPSAELPAADLASIYLPGLLVATEAAATKLRDSLVEELPVRVQGQPALILNPQFTIRRFREKGSNALRIPSGAVLLLHAADFYEEDIPSHIQLFWLHDGNFPRFLLCTEAFMEKVGEAKLSGLTFTRLGYARADA